MSARPFWPSTYEGAFTLVEVTLALGIVAFALVAIIGVMPLALSTERISFDEGRASAVANTVFASFRSQNFQQVSYVDSQYDSLGNAIGPSASPTPLNLATMAVPSNLTVYATFLGVASDNVSGDTIGSQKRLLFTSSPPASGADYKLTLYFTMPTGIIPVSGQPTRAIQMEVAVAPLHESQSLFHFVNTVINTSN